MNNIKAWLKVEDVMQMGWFFLFIFCYKVLIGSDRKPSKPNEIRSIVFNCNWTKVILTKHRTRFGWYGFVRLTQLCSTLKATFHHIWALHTKEIKLPLPLQHLRLVAMVALGPLLFCLDQTRILPARFSFLIKKCIVKDGYFYSWFFYRKEKCREHLLSPQCCFLNRHGATVADCTVILRWAN